MKPAAAVSADKRFDKTAITVHVEDGNWRSSIRNVTTFTRQAALAALEQTSAASSSALTILLADDGRLADLNGQFRGKNQPTNVLSFPASSNDKSYLGDIAVAYGIAAREASEKGIPLTHHLAHLVVHGVLHLVGYDHQSERQARIMEPLEAKILATMKISDPYSSQLAL